MMSAMNSRCHPLPDDLIGRLRDGANDLCCPECCYGQTMIAAADEIDRLRAALREVVARDKTGFGRASLASVARGALQPQ